MSLFKSVKDLTNALVDIADTSIEICTTSVQVVAVSLVKVQEGIEWVRDEMSAIEIMDEQRAVETKSTTLDEL